MEFRSKRHRLPPAAYRGQFRLAVTACLERRIRGFEDGSVVQVCVELLKTSLERFSCHAQVYCFMPDHFHAILDGVEGDSLPKVAMDNFKESSGAWFAENRPSIHWQASYFDHKIRSSEDWHAQAAYILANPVRAGLVADRLDYPFSGSIGPDFKELVEEIGWGNPIRPRYQKRLD